MAWDKRKPGEPIADPQTFADVAAMARAATPAIMRRLIEYALREPNPNMAMKAAELVLDRGLGKAIQPVDNSASLLDLLEPADREAIIRAFSDEPKGARADLGRDTAGTC